ncbi:Uncharacterised protein [Bordetella pertussis]|nr:Uncharacterised protein [Bordetella pertussis]CPP42776.1 Uncharacterised protein [Bordetella pertussis]CRE28627.1 Uncharacterised protein [Bordetella pertussis]
MPRSMPGSEPRASSAVSGRGASATMRRSRACSTAASSSPLTSVGRRVGAAQQGADTAFAVGERFHRDDPHPPVDGAQPRRGDMDVGKRRAQYHQGAGVRRAVVVDLDQLRAGSDLEAEIGKVFQLFLVRGIVSDQKDDIERTVHEWCFRID